MNFTENIALSIGFLLAASLVLMAREESFTAVSVEGTARVQRSNQYKWEKIDSGDRIFDNDIIETFFQTKVVLKFGDGNFIVLGSNSKVLCNIALKSVENEKIAEAGFTLFGGGIFSKAVKSCRINIYTANALAVFDSGSLTAIVETKRNETGFQALAGVIKIRNIAQQKAIDLRSGFTSIIQANREPTAPLYITQRHTEVLKHYFGNDYISSELDASNIKPTSDRSASNTGFVEPYSGRARGTTGEGTYKPLFNINRIYGSILDERNKYGYGYSPIKPAAFPMDNSRIVALQTDIGLSQDIFSPRITPLFMFQHGGFQGGVRLSVFKNADEDYVFGFSSLAGIIDKIEHISWEKKDGSRLIHAGEMRNITFGYGLIVDNFSNINPNNAFHPLGVTGRLDLSDNFSIKTFVSDITLPVVSGIYMDLGAGIYRMGLGYAADFNQYLNTTAVSGSRYDLLSHTKATYPAQPQNISHVHCYCVDLTADIVNNYDLQMRLVVEFAQKLFGGNDGFVARLPSFHVTRHKLSCGGGGIIESGRLLSGQFDAGYMTNRYRIKNDKAYLTDTLITPNNFLPRDRRAFGISAFCKMNPFRGTDVDISYKQDISARNNISIVSNDSVVTQTVNGDFSFNLRLAINDSLVKFIKYAEISLRQAHGRMYPAKGLPFAGWTFAGEYRISSIPVFNDFVFETAGRFFYIDKGPVRNNRIERDDMATEISISINWGF